jgi:predicted amidohydrolase YtcJ
MKKFNLYSCICLLLLMACGKNNKVDLIVKGAKIYTIDSVMKAATVMVINQGKIVAVGGDELLAKYQSDSVLMADDKFIYPGLIDAHSHFYGLGAYMQTVDLTNTKSWDEVLTRCKDFVAKYNPLFLTGRGWDQNDWAVKNFPNNEALNKLFPDFPVLLKRIDGHAAIANNKALELAQININTKIDGGDLIKSGNQLTGVLIDNAVDLVQEKLPKPDKASITKSLLLAQEVCIDLGLTSVCDAGLDTEVIEVIDSLQKTKQLFIRVYAMISANDKQVDEWLKRKPIKTDVLNVSSIKMYADGALGSRGACLLKPYHDQHQYHGLILTPLAKMETYVKLISNSPYQLNTHCIGDSANRFVMNLYGKYLGENNNRRWRIEHAQVVHQNDFNLFRKYNIVPSVQPTHATSDMYWAEDRLGKERIKGAYALKTLLKQNGWLPLGTDFPVEPPQPFYTYYAAVARKDAKQFPEAGFQMQDALTKEEALRGMTIWAAKSAFEEDIKGSLETGKLADFIIMDLDLLKADMRIIKDTKPSAVYVGGKKVK